MLKTGLPITQCFYFGLCYFYRLIALHKKEEKVSWRLCDYHKRCRGDVGEQVDRNAPADEDGSSQAGKAFAAAPAGGMGPGIVANHHASLPKVRKTLLQVAAETLSKETDDAKISAVLYKIPPPFFLFFLVKTCNMNVSAVVCHVPVQGI